MNTTSQPSLPLAREASAGDWLSLLCAQSLGDFDLAEDLDIDLSARAIAARSDHAERNHLFPLLATKINRFVLRFSRWDLEPWEFDDVRQQTFLVFEDVLTTWEPLDLGGRPAGFVPYFLRVFPMRLAGAVRDMRRCPPTTLIPWMAEYDSRPDPLDVVDAATTHQIMADICGQLNAADSAIFRLRVTLDPLDRDLVDQTGISRRTLYRRWGKILGIARAALRKAG
jgi:hypothetical protein